MSNEQRYRKALEEIAENGGATMTPLAQILEYKSIARQALTDSTGDEGEKQREDVMSKTWDAGYSMGEKNERARVVAIIRDACFTGIGPRNPNPTWQDIIDTIQTNKEGG